MPPPFIVPSPNASNTEVIIDMVLNGIMLLFCIIALFAEMFSSKRTTASTTMNTPFYTPAANSNKKNNSLKLNQATNKNKSANKNTPLPPTITGSAYKRK